MRFDEKWPHARAGDSPGGVVHPPVDNDWQALKGKGESLCSRCRQPTSWVNISFEAWMCSEECVAAEWDEFFEACRRTA